jgi:hypothetical protein
MWFCPCYALEKSKVAGIVSEVRKNVDLFGESMDSFVSFLRCSKDSFRGFVSDTCFQKVRFVDSFRSTVFKGFDLFFWIQRILPKRNESLLHKHALKDLWCSKDSFCGFVSSTVFKRFVCGFVSDTCFQITHFVDSFREKKSQKGLIRFVSEGFVYESRIPRKKAN